MARKIGFGQAEKPTKPPAPSIADRYVEEFRAKGRQLEDTDISGQETPAEGHWAIIIFLLVWLTAWSIGIVAVAVLIVSGGFDGFLILWETLAILGWFAAVYAMVQTIKGKVNTSKDTR